MTTPDDPTLDPAAVASASFTTSRRGFDPTEVRAYLQQLSTQVRALVDREAAVRQQLDQLQASPARTGELDEATVAAWLGEEAARVLTTAREAATQVRGKAQDQAEQLVAEARAEADRVRAEAHAEAARQRDEVAAEIARRREESVAEAQAEIEAARQEGRGMVSEARAVRERMLADLSRRRDGARTQLAALRGERDRIVNAIEATRDHLDRLMDDLRSASPDDDRDLPPVPYEQDLRGVGVGEPRLTLVRPLHPVHAERRADDEPAAGGPAGETATEAPAVGEPEVAGEGADTVPAPQADVEVDEEPTVGLVLGEVEVTEVIEVEVTEVTAEPEVAQPEAAEPEQAGDLLEPADDGAVEVEAVEVDVDAVQGGPADLTDVAAADDHAGPITEEIEVVAGPEDAEPKPSVDDLFARIRAARTEAVAPPEPVSSEGEPPVTEGAADEPAPLEGDAALLAERDEAVAGHQATLSRQLKRALADEQNEVFDRLRRATTVGDAESVLGPDAGHAERYRAAGEDAVWAAALAGAAATAAAGAESAEGGLEGALERHRVLDEVLDEISLELAMPLRERLELAVAQSGGDPAEATALLRNAYREWKAQRIDELASQLVLAAHGRGAYAAVPPGALVRWVVDPATPACQASTVDEQAGWITAGDAFPSGHRHPPAHAGCRCLIVARQR